MMLFNLAPVRFAPFSHLNMGLSMSLGFNFCHVKNAFTGQSGPSFWYKSTTVGVADFDSLGHFRQIWITVFPPSSRLQDTSFVSSVKSGSNVDSNFDKISPILKPPAKATVDTAHSSLLSFFPKSEFAIVFLKTSIMFTVIGNLPFFGPALFWIPSRFSIPLRTSFTRLLRIFGGSSPFTTCNCRTPARYEFTVLAFSLRILTSQSIKMRVFFWLKGIERSALVSDSHFWIIVRAVLYVLHVLREMPMFPSSARAAAASRGRSRSLSRSAAHPPFDPYFALPLTGVGLKPLGRP
jgi:hypothetical protein